MLTDFQPRCIMIFMAVSSEILLATHIAGRCPQYPLPIGDGCGAGCGVRNRKRTDFLYPSSLGTA